MTDLFLFLKHIMITIRTSSRIMSVAHTAYTISAIVLDCSTAQTSGVVVEEGTVVERTVAAIVVKIIVVEVTVVVLSDSIIVV